MNFFPNPSELQFLVGKELVGVRFGTGSVYFQWWEGGGIEAFNRFEHVDRDGVTHSFEIMMLSDGPSLLHQLIQLSVSAIDVRDTSLQLNFVGGQQLRFYAGVELAENGLIRLSNDPKGDYIIY